MDRKLRTDAEKAACTAINAVMPEGAVRRMAVAPLPDTVGRQRIPDC